jgi:hypothetical protein
MYDCLHKERYDSAALNGIHAVISLVDAYVIYNYGVVSAGKRHEDAIELLLNMDKDPMIKKQANHARYVIRLKGIVEYLECLTTQKQAYEIEKHVKRLYEWMSKKLHFTIHNSSFPYL